jgi:hypothetical protein
LRQLEQEHEALRKKINVKVMNMIDRYALGWNYVTYLFKCRDKRTIIETDAGYCQKG